MILLLFALCDVQPAIDAVNAGRIAEGERILEEALVRCPDDPVVLREFAGLRFRQNRWEESETLAEKAVDVDPELEWAWDVMGSSRYLMGDRMGALEAWNRIGRPVVDGDLLTPARIERLEAEARLQPTVARARAEYRPTPGGGAEVEIHLLHLPTHPFTRLQLPLHVARAATLSGDFQGTVGSSALRVEGHESEVRASFAHPSTFRWEAEWSDHRESERRSASVHYLRPRLTLRMGIDRWESTHARAGVGVRLGPVRAEADAWSGGFVRTSLTAMGSTGERWEIRGRGGVVLVSEDAPPDLEPRFGAGPSATHLFRAVGVHPETSRLHGGLELIRWEGPFGIATFIDAMESDIAVGAGVRFDQIRLDLAYADRWRLSIGVYSAGG